MRILHAIQSADPSRGGPIEGILQIAQATAGEHTHRLLTLDDPSAKFLSASRLPTSALGPSGILGYSPRLVPWLRARASEYDLAIVHGLWRYISVGTWRALRKSKLPYVVMPHGMLDPWFKHHYPLKHYKKWLFWPWTEYRVLRDARAVIFTCDEERRLARRSFWLYHCVERVGTVGIRGPEGDLQQARQRFFATYPQVRNKRIILFLGRVHEKKGCDLLIEAFAQLAPRHTDMHLVMAGPCHDDLVDRLRALCAARGIAERVTWTGMLTGEVKWGALAAAEVFTLPSHQENFGIAVAEALSCATPVLISNKVQIWREIEADGGGLINEDTLQGCLAMLNDWLALSEPAKAAMGHAARRCFEHRYEARHYASVMTRLYQEAVGVT